MDRDPLELERAGWRALAATPEVARAFYEEVLADRALFVLPGGMVLDDRASILDSMAGAPWDGHELADERTMALGDGSVIVAYRTTAERGGERYEAWITSTYVREDGAWRLALHQQTPT